MKEILMKPKTIIKHITHTGICFSQKFSFKERLKMLFHKTVWFDLYATDYKRIRDMFDNREVDSICLLVEEYEKLGGNHILGIDPSDGGDYTCEYGKVKRNDC